MCLSPVHILTKHLRIPVPVQDFVRYRQLSIIDATAESGSSLSLGAIKFPIAGNYSEEPVPVLRTSPSYQLYSRCDSGFVYKYHYSGASGGACWTQGAVQVVVAATFSKSMYRCVYSGFPGYRLLNALVLVLVPWVTATSS